jgi:heme/copper-type cytochrome/quinol oxidase subunit 2
MVHWLMLALFVGWGAFFIYSLFRFRASKNPRADYVGVKGHTSTYLEVGVAVFEGILLVGFAVPLWSSVVNAFPAEKDATVIRVVAEQFAWNAHYAGADGIFGKSDINLITADNPLGLDRNDPAGKDDITTINQLNFPVGKPVLVYLTTKDVIHSFGIPLLRVKQDAIPGQNIPLWFKATKTTREIQESLMTTISIKDGKTPGTPDTRVAMADYNGKDGNPILKKGDPVGEELIPQLLEAGIQEILVAPATPTEIACSQLCGLGHFRMRGFVNIQTDEEFKAWLAEEASDLGQ